MTAIQLLALFGVFVIGNIVGSYATFRFFRFALRHSTVVGMEIGTCEDPDCSRMHLRVNTLNATASLGVTQTVLDIDPKIAAILLKAFDTPEAKETLQTLR